MTRPNRLTHSLVGRHAYLVLALAACAALALAGGGWTAARANPLPDGTGTPPPESSPTGPPAATPVPEPTPPAAVPPRLDPWLMAGASLVVVVLSGALVGALGIWLFRRGQASARPAPAGSASTPAAAAPVAAPPQAAPPKAAPAATPEQPPAITPYLEFEGTQGGTRRFFVGAQPITVGRAPDCDVCITETFPGWDSVSRRHARILREVRHGQTRFIVEDLSSRNGVFVNGRRTGRNVLRDGWRVSLGRLTFTYRSHEAGSPREWSAAP